MNQLPPEDTKSIAVWLLGALVGILTWIGKRQINRLSELEKKLDAEKEIANKMYVTRRELKETIERIVAERREMTDERREMHKQNTDSLNRIHARLDELWKRNYGSPER